SITARQAGARGRPRTSTGPVLEVGFALRPRSELEVGSALRRTQCAMARPAPGWPCPSTEARVPGSGGSGFGVRGLGARVGGPAVPGPPWSPARLGPPERGGRQGGGSTAHCCCAIPPLQPRPDEGAQTGPRDKVRPSVPLGTEGLTPCGRPRRRVPSPAPEARGRDGSHAITMVPGGRPTARPARPPCGVAGASPNPSRECRARRSGPPWTGVPEDLTGHRSAGGRELLLLGTVGDHDLDLAR